MNEHIAKAKAISKQFDIEILQCLGFSEATPAGVQCACPIHGGDNPTAFCYDSEKKIWSCFTKQCQKKYGNDMIGLIRSMLDCDFNSAVNWIHENIGVREDVDVSSIYNSSSIDEYLSHGKKKNDVIPESKLDNLKKIDGKSLDLLKSKNFDEDVFKFFEAGYCDSDKIIHQRIMIPIRSKESEIVGFTGRSIWDQNPKTGGFYPENFTPSEGYEKIFSKWRMYPKNFNKSIELYNIHKAKDYIKETNKCFIVEGAFDVWSMWTAGFKNSVATMGTSLTKQQCQMLVESGCVKLYLVYDSDDAGRIASQKIKEKYSDMFEISTIVLPDGKDPSDLTVEELQIETRKML